MKTLIIIPAYNEGENISKVVDKLIDNYSQYDYVVINDGSKDDTAAVCQRNNYNLLNLPINLGLAGAFQTGLRYAYQNGYDTVVQIDGDGQHNPEYIEEMIACMEETQSDVVLGSRFKEKRKPKTLRMIGNRMIQLAIKLSTGRKLTDPTSGMRLFNKAMVDRFARNMNYGPEPDTIAYLLRCGAKVSEVQVDMNERTAGVSYLSMGRSIVYMVNMCISIVVIQFFRKKEV